MKPLILKKPEARQDLLDHFVYIGQDTPKAAARFLEAAEDTFVQLAGMPRMGRSWDSPHPHLAGVRVGRVQGFRNYLVFYRPVEDGIEVLHVFHRARDIESLLEAEFPEGWYRVPGVA
jgi:toxin ParE1/3/4